MEERERERDRDREKANLLKEDMDASVASKRRKLKRDQHLPPGEPGEFSPGAPPPPSLSMGVSQSYDGRDRGDRKGAMMRGYVEDSAMRIHSKEVAGKMTRRDSDPYP